MIAIKTGLPFLRGQVGRAFANVDHLVNGHKFRAVFDCRTGENLFVPGMDFKVDMLKFRAAMHPGHIFFSVSVEGAHLPIDPPFGNVNAGSDIQVFEKGMMAHHFT